VASVMPAAITAVAIPISALSPHWQTALLKSWWGSFFAISSSLTKLETVSKSEDSIAKLLGLPPFVLVGRRVFPTPGFM